VDLVLVVVMAVVMTGPTLLMVPVDTHMQIPVAVAVVMLIRYLQVKLLVLVGRELLYVDIRYHKLNLMPQRLRKQRVELLRLKVQK
jgi:uncharacterized membrane protein